MASPQFLFHRLFAEDIDILKKRQKHLEQSLIEMRQQIYKLQMTQQIDNQGSGVECVPPPPPDTSTFNWVATGLFLILGIGAIISASKS